MPSSSMFQDGPTDIQQHLQADSRTYQLALELSLIGFNSQLDSINNIENDCQPDPLSAFVSPLVTASMNDEVRSKKSQNMTECVPVPSSEHVAEIVGRQGCKIKALRAKTNTYIKTPVRGEEPVFVVTGRKEDVAKAKREILSAAEHFSQIRASRKNNLAAVSSGASTPPGPPTNIPGQITIQVRVPYRVVGLVVGPKGATIKRIQHQTHTYIVTPSRDKEPIFEVTGMPENVESARKEIQAHIAMRTGNGSNAIGSDGLGSGMGSNNLLEEDSLLTQLYIKSGGGVCLGSFMNYGLESPTTTMPTTPPSDLFHPLIGSSANSSNGNFSSSCSTASSVSGRERDIQAGFWTSGSDEGLGGDSSPILTDNIWSFPIANAAPCRPSPAHSASPVDSLLSSSTLHGVNTIASEILNQSSNLRLGSPSSLGGCGTIGSSLTTNTLSSSKSKKCIVCNEGKVTHAFVPCGHIIACYDCAHRAFDGIPDPACPYCSKHVNQALQIIAPIP